MAVHKTIHRLTSNSVDHLPSMFQASEFENSNRYRKDGSERIISGLHRAIDDGRFKAIEYMLKMDANPNVRDHKGLTPVMRCVTLDNTGLGVWLLKALLRSGADPTWRDKTGLNVLGQAIRHGNVPVAAVLLEYNDLNLHHTDRSGNTTLHLLADCKPEMAQLVLSAAKRFHVSVDVLNEEGMTPLMLTCFRMNIPVARIFVEAGASLSRRDTRWHYSAVDWMEVTLRRPLLPGELPFPQRIPKPVIQLPSRRSSEGTSSTASFESRHTSPQNNPPQESERIRFSMGSLPSLLARHSSAPVSKSGRLSASHTEGNPILRRVYSLYEAQISSSFRVGVFLEKCKDQPGLDSSDQAADNEPEQTTHEGGRSNRLMSNAGFPATDTQLSRAQRRNKARSSALSPDLRDESASSRRPVRSAKKNRSNSRDSRD